MPTLELSRKLVEKIEQAARQNGESPEAFLLEAVIARLEDLAIAIAPSAALRMPSWSFS